MRNANSGAPFCMNSVPSAVLYDWPISRPPRTSRRRVTKPDATSMEFLSTGAANASKAKAWHNNATTAALHICFLISIFGCPLLLPLRCVHFQSASSTFENDAVSTKERNSAASSEVKPPANRMEPGALRFRDEAKHKALAISVLAA